MNRIARRALAVLLLAVVLAGGMLFFLWEYGTQAREWVMFSGSPHVYNGRKLAQGMILDRDGALLLDLAGDKTYAPNARLREAVLHWVGDRQGNIRTAAVSHYEEEMLGYDPVNGLYAYGGEVGRMSLTLSSPVQLAALDALDGRRGTVGVYNYRTGEILCAVTTPTYDPDNVPDIAGDTTGAYQGAYLNRFLQAAYIPGSIFKVVTLAAAIETQPDLQERSFPCTGVYQIGTGDVTCEAPHGEQDIWEALAHSCNCAFAQVVELLGKETLTRYVEQFGITDSIEFDGITTAQGHFDISQSYGELVAWSGIGQHTDQINPCAYMTFMGAIADGGAGVTPYVVEKITVGKATTYRSSTQRRDRIMSQATAELVKEMMRNNVVNGYGVERFPEGMTVCAKSGTAQVGGGQEPNSMLAGFVDDEQYPYAFIVVVENGGYGGVTCVPIITQVLNACKAMADGQK